MAIPGVKVSELRTLTQAADDDFLVINDTSVTTTKKITVANFLGSTTTQNVTDSADGGIVVSNLTVTGSASIASLAASPQYENGTAASPSITFVSDQTSGLYYIGGANNEIGVTADGALVSKFSDLGNNIIFTDDNNTIQGVRAQNQLKFVGDGATETFCSFVSTNTGSEVVEGSVVTTSGAGTAYNVTSDYRVKENIVELENALDRVSQLHPIRYNRIGSSTVIDGFLAHEVAEVVPEAVTGAKDEVDENGMPLLQGLDQTKVIPILVAAIQELKQRIEDLEGR